MQGLSTMGQKLLMPGVVHSLNMFIGEHCNTGFLLRPSQLLVVHRAVTLRARHMAGLRESSPSIHFQFSELMYGPT